MTPNSPGAARRAEEAFFDFWGILRRRRVLLVAGAILGTVAGIAVGIAFFGILDYQSNARILVVKKRLETAPLTGPAPDQPQFEDYLSTHQVVILSPRIINDAIKHDKLDELSCFAGASPAKIAAIISNCLSADRVFQVRGGGPPNNILNLYYRAENPNDAPVVLNAILASYQRFLNESTRSRHTEALELIKQAKDVIQKEIEAKEKAYVEFRKETALWRRKEGGVIHIDRLTNIDAKRTALRVRQIEIQAALGGRQDVAAGDSGEVVPAVAVLPASKNVVNSALLVSKEPWQPGRSARSTLEEELINLQLQEAKLLEKFGVNHSQVMATRKRIDLVRQLILPAAPGAGGEFLASLRDLGDLNQQQLRQELNESKRAEEMLREVFDQEVTQAKLAGANESLDEFYRKSIDRSQALYDGIINRLKEVDSVKDYGTYSTQMLAEPAAGRWLWRRFGLISAIGLFLGLAMSFAAGLVLDRRQMPALSPQ